MAIRTTKVRVPPPARRSEHGSHDRVRARGDRRRHDRNARPDLGEAGLAIKTLLDAVLDKVMALFGIGTG
jgi:hypothetical protein